MSRSSKFNLQPGDVFGKLTVIGFAGRKTTESSITPQYYWKCKCECGKETEVVRACLTYGKTKSCGCLKKNVLGTPKRRRAREFPVARTPEYRAWIRARRYCYDKSHKCYANYGGRGISMCDRWLNSFENFLEDMGKRPSAKHSIDRYPDNNGNYEPGNCRWATQSEQARNRRSNRIIEYQGTAMTMAEFSERIHMPARLVASRLRSGWSIERIAATPVAKKQVATSRHLAIPCP